MSFKLYMPFTFSDRILLEEQTSKRGLPENVSLRIASCTTDWYKQQSNRGSHTANVVIAYQSTNLQNYNLKQSFECNWTIAELSNSVLTNL